MAMDKIFPNSNPSEFGALALHFRSSDNNRVNARHEVACSRNGKQRKKKEVNTSTSCMANLFYLLHGNPPTFTGAVQPLV